MSCRLLLMFVLVVAAGFATPVRAEGIISPFIGFIGSDSNCPNLFTCEDTKHNVGVGVGVLGSVIGFEEEFGYVKNFFGEAPGLDSNMLTLMSNFLIAPKIGPVRPFGVVGVGLMRSSASLGVSNVLDSDNNNVGMDFGGGLMVFFGSHVGIRGDVRRYQSLQDVKALGFTLSDSKIVWGQVTGAVVFAF